MLIETDKQESKSNKVYRITATRNHSEGGEVVYDYRTLDEAQDMMSVLAEDPNTETLNLSTVLLITE